MKTAPASLVAQARFDSPIGQLTAAVTARGLAQLWFEDPGLRDLPDDPAHPWLAQARQELEAYWGDCSRTFSVPLDLHGTPFQQAVWRALLGIEAGHTRSYSDVANVAGAPRAVRAVGAAIGRNPVVIIVPCHRVIGRDGSLTGFAGGLQRKAALLAHESPQQALA